MPEAALRFACTQCGKCCNRPPEVLLSEAAGLADVFVFRLMFRLYRLPRLLGDEDQRREPAAATAEEFYQQKRLLAAHAARKYATRLRRGSKVVDYTHYLMISALSLDTGRGACGALRNNVCNIYERRPLACRTVPFHYSRTEAAAARDFNAFIATPGYRCDTGGNAPVVLDGGRIIDQATYEARDAALKLAERERAWKEAIVRRMKAASSGKPSLPSLAEVEANASFGATTTSMRAAWQIAAECGLIESDEQRRLTAVQMAAIERELAQPNSTRDARETLLQMRSEYLPHRPVHGRSRPEQ